MALPAMFAVPEYEFAFGILGIIIAFEPLRILLVVEIFPVCW
jgi:hypothetical protein